MTTPALDSLTAAPSVWFTQLGLHVDGKPFELWPEYAYLLEPYDAMVMPNAPQHLVVSKGAQMGWSIWAILQAIYGAYAIYHSDHIIYYFPTERTVLKFSKSRFGPMLKENEALSGIVGESVNSALLKEIRNIRGTTTYIDFLGMQSKEALKSIPSHHNFYDESDEMSRSSIARSMHRLDNSPYARTTHLSTPSLPNWGVELQYSVSDKRRWLIRCEACNADTCLELEFPECLHRMADGSVIRACVKCGREVHTRNGRWVAEAPSVDLRGYHINQLNHARVTPATILHEYETHTSINGTPIDLPEFHNQRLAQGYLEADACLTREQVLGICGDEPALGMHNGPCCMGVDVKLGQYHYEVGSVTGDNRTRAWKLGIATSLDEIADIARAFHVECCVIDAMPDVNAVKLFCETFPWAWRTFLPDQFGSSAVWNARDWTVKSNRNEAIEAAFNAVLFKRHLLPRADSRTEDLVVKPFCNMAKSTKIDEETGIPKTRWVVLGTKDNDMWMAHVHFMLAATRTAAVRDVRVARAQPAQLDVGYDPLAASDASMQPDTAYDPLGALGL